MRVLIFAIALAGCSPYEPSLPHKPFLCGETEPRCPDGYTCVNEDDRMVCSDLPPPDAAAATRGAR